MKRIFLILLSALLLTVWLPLSISAQAEVGAGDTVYASVTEEQGEGGWYFMAAPEGTDFWEYMPAFIGDNWWAGENNFQMGMIQQDHIHPGLNYDAVLGYQFPASGNVTVSFPGGAVVNDSSAVERPGDGVTIGVFYQDDSGVQTLLPMSDVGNGETLEIDDITLDVRAGALILFRCGNGHNHYMDYDNTYFAPEITYNSVSEDSAVTKRLLPAKPGEKQSVTIGCGTMHSDNPTVITGSTYEIGADKSGSVLSLADVQTDGTAVIISASDVAITDFSVNGGSVAVTGERVTMVNCAVSAPMTVDGVGFFAQNCDFADVTVTGGDTVIARSNLAGAVSLTGRNQTLYGNVLTGSLSVSDASDISVISNTLKGGGVITKSKYINLTDNTSDHADIWQYDDRAVLWGSDLPGTLDGTDYAGVDASRLPQNNNDRFAQSTVRTHIYYNGDFVQPNVYLLSAGANYEEVIFPAGIYENLPQFSIVSQENITVAAYGMCARFASYTTSAVAVTQSDNIHILGMTIDHMLSANAQGTVISNSGGKLIWRPDAGYDCEITNESLYAKTGASLGFKAGEKLPFADQLMSERQKNSDGTYTLTVSSQLQSGDRLTFRGLASHVCTINYAGAVTFADVTIWGGSGFAFSGWMGEDRVTLSRCIVTPGPKPAGATEDRMLSTCDASHFSNMRVGPVLEDCVFTDMTDDGTNINGHYMMTSAYNADSNTFSIDPDFDVATGNYASHTDGVEIGDRIRILSLDFAWIGDTTAASTADNGAIRLADRFDGMTDRVILQNLDRQSNDFAIRNCVVERIRSRGLLIKGTDGVIEHCTIRDVRMSGILVKPESHEWPEFGFAQNLIIRNNHIIGTGYAAPTNGLYAAINVSGDGVQSSDPIYQLHRNLVIEGNFIENRRNETAIKVSHAADVSVKNNVITARDASVHGDPANDVAIPITVISATNVEISGNTVPASARGYAEQKTGTNNIWGTDLKTENAPIEITDPQPIREETAETEGITDLTESEALEVIGGADGPTAIITTGSLLWLYVAAAVLVIAIGITVGVLVVKKKRK